MASRVTSELKWHVFGSNGRVAFSAFFFSFVLNVLELTGSLFMLQVYDRVLPSGSVPTLVALGLIVLVLYGYYGVLDYVRSRFFVRVGRKVEEGLRERAFDAMSTL